MVGVVVGVREGVGCWAEGGVGGAIQGMVGWASAHTLTHRHTCQDCQSYLVMGWGIQCACSVYIVISCMHGLESLVILKIGLISLKIRWEK